MTKRQFLAWRLALTLGALAAGGGAQAHAVAGARIFVDTLEIDDPGVGDEANLPIFSLTSPDGKSTNTFLNFEYDKTIFSNLGVAAGTSFNYVTHDSNDNNKAHGGFGNPYVQLKYRWILLPEHEFMSSVQVQEQFGRGGSRAFDSGYDTTVFSGYFGKGLGDIPLDAIRPFALTGELDYVLPSIGFAGGYGDINSWSGGLTLQYSIPYLESQIHDYGLPWYFADLTPLAELGWTSAAGRSAFAPTGHPTTFLVGTGAVWTGEYNSFSTEILWPLNGATQHGIGVIGQFHLYFDDLYPNTLGKPLFGT